MSGTADLQTARSRELRQEYLRKAIPDALRKQPMHFGKLLSVLGCEQYHEVVGEMVHEFEQAGKIFRLRPSMVLSWAESPEVPDPVASDPEVQEWKKVWEI